MSPVNNHHSNMTIYYNHHHHQHHQPQQQHQYQHHYRQDIATSPTLSSNTSLASAARLGQIQAQLELARNFYDDDEFCPVQCSYEVMEHRDRIQQRLSPQSSPSTSPSLSSASSLGITTPPRHNKSRRAIPIIDPSSMAPVSVPSQHQYNNMMKSPMYVNQQQQQQQYSMRHNGYDVLVQ